MLGKLISVVVLCVVFSPIISPIKINIVYARGNDKVLVALDVCHASSPFQPSGSISTPFYPAQSCRCLLNPGLTGFYKPLPPLLKSPLLAFEKEDPPRA